MFYRKGSKNPSEIELTTISQKEMTASSLLLTNKIENYNEIIRALLINPNILPLAQIKDSLHAIIASQDQIITNAMKANITALNKNNQSHLHLAINWNQDDKPQLINEESLKIPSFTF